MRDKRRLIMWRDDHIGDTVGAIFLGVADDTLARLATYFGPKIRVLKVEMVQNQAHVEIECVSMPDESNRLVAGGNDLRTKGMPRGARAMFEEALALDPLNGNAMLGLAMLLDDQKRHAEALAMLKRAREAGDDRVEILQALAQVSLKLELPGNALGYLLRAAEIAPNDPAIRRALSSLDRKQHSPATEGTAPEPADTPRRNTRA